MGAATHAAPERTGRLSRSVDFRSDLYALGVTLYELLSGRLPFSASTTAEWIQCHIVRAPLTFEDGIPATLVAIILRLLEKAPEDRYQSASSLEADLLRCEVSWRSLGRVEPFSLGSRDVEGSLALPRRLYGRQEEAARLLRSFTRVVETGELEVVVISGPSGIGKSALVRELDGAVAAAGALFAAGKFDQYKRNTPHAALAEALEQLVRRVLQEDDLALERYRDGLREAVGANGALMVNLVPELALLIGVQPALPVVFRR